MTAPVLQIEGLRVEFPSAEGPRAAVHGVSLSVGRGEMVGLVGESGCGKSLTCRSAIRLVPSPGRIAAGSVRVEGRDVLAMSGAELRRLRAHDVGMVFQDPFSSLNPVFRVGAQVAETLRENLGLASGEARARAVRLLEEAGIPDAERWSAAYPHELSGGMRQRVMIALATAAEPKLLIADEPSTALDVTTQAQILALLRRLREERGMAVLLVSHDFGVIAQTCDRVAVMYGGHVVETGPVESVYATPQHPYTRALLASVPALESAGRGRRREAIPGQPPEPGEEPPGCVFAPRCTSARPECAGVSMKLEPAGGDQASACPFVRVDQVSPAAGEGRGSP